MSAAQAGMPALFVSLEQSQIDIANRLLSAMTGLPFTDIEHDSLTDSLDRERLVDAENQLAALPFKIAALPLKMIDESSSRLFVSAGFAETGFPNVGDAGLHSERRHGLRLLILDDLQLLHPDDDRIRRERQAAGMSRTLERLARELDIVVVCLAQRNRDIESRERKPS